LLLLYVHDSVWNDRKIIRLVVVADVVILSHVNKHFVTDNSCFVGDNA
jgi:hypothetical protein